jgi:Homeodomain-like domain
MGARKRDKIFLSPEERHRLELIARNGHSPAKKILHAQILLMADEGELSTGRWTDEAIASALNMHRNTVGRIRYKYLREGEGPALDRKIRQTPPVPPKVDGALEAQIVALCCSSPPSGYSDWSIRLLTSELKARQIVTEISRETVRRTLKKTNCVPGKQRVSASRSGT